MNPRILEALAAAKAAEEADPGPAAQVAQMAFRAQMAAEANFARAAEADRAQMAAAIARMGPMVEPSQNSEAAFDRMAARTLAAEAAIPAIQTAIQGFVRNNEAAIKAALETFISVMEGAAQIATAAAARVAEFLARLGPRYAAVLAHSDPFPFLHYLAAPMGEELMGDLAAAAAQEEIKAAGLPEAANVLLTRWTRESLNRVRLNILAANTGLADDADLWGIWARATKAPGELLLWDELLLTELERVGSQQGQERRTKARERWAASLAADGFADGPNHPDVNLFRLWQFDGGTCKAALWLASSILEAHRDELKRPPAITTAVYSPLMEAMGTKVRRSDIDSPQLPLIPLDASLALTLAAVQGLAGNALLRWVGITGHHAYMAGEEWTDFETDVRGRRGGVAGAELVIIRGGWSRLATLVGLSSRGETVADLREALRTLAGCSLRWRYAAREGGGSLLTWEGSLERGELKIGVSTPLLPYAGFRYWKKGDPSPRLVPLTRLPFMEGINPKARAAVARLDFVVWADLAERRVRPEGVELDWPALAHQAGVTNHTLPVVLDLWSSPGEGQRWERDGNLWRPFTGDLELATAWEFLLAGSANRTEAEERGRRGGRQPKPNRRR